jgi:hypothetical protein
MADETQETQGTAGQDQTQDQSAAGQKEGAGDKPIEQLTWEEMSPQQQALVKQGALMAKAHYEKQAEEKRAEAEAAAARQKQSRADSDDPNAPVEKEIEKLVTQAVAEAGEGATGAKVLVKSLTKLLLAQTNMTKQMAEEIAEKKVAALAASDEERSAKEFYASLKLKPEAEGKLRDYIKKHRVNAYDLMDVIETIRPKSKGGDDTDEEYEQGPKAPKDIDDYSFLETPSRRGESAPAHNPGKEAATLAKAAVEAEKAGDPKKRDQLLNKYMRASRRLRVA